MWILRKSKTHEFINHGAAVVDGTGGVFEY